MYEIIYGGYSKHFAEEESCEATAFAKEMSEIHGCAVKKDWEECWVYEYEQGEYVRCYPMDCSTDSDDDWEDEYPDADYPYDYDEPADIDDDRGWDPYMGCYTGDC